MAELQVLHYVQMLRASEAGLLAGLFNAKALSLELRNSQINLTASFAFRDFPSPAFGTRRVQSAIRKAAIKSAQNECRRKMLALALFFYDRVQPRTLYETCHFSGLVELSPLGRSVKYKVSYITTLAGAYNTVKGKERPRCSEEPAGIACKANAATECLHSGMAEPNPRTP